MKDTTLQISNKQKKADGQKNKKGNRDKLKKDTKSKRDQKQDIAWKRFPKTRQTTHQESWTQ